MYLLIYNKWSPKFPTLNMNYNNIVIQCYIYCKCSLFERHDFNCIKSKQLFQRKNYEFLSNKMLLAPVAKVRKLEFCPLYKYLKFDNYLNSLVNNNRSYIGSVSRCRGIFN